MSPTRTHRAATTMLDQYWQPTGICGLIARTALRTSQFVFAAIAAGLYAPDLSNGGPTNWIYAEVAAGLSMVTCAIHCFATVTNVAWCVWDFVVCVLWAAAFGVFGSTFIGTGEVGSEDWNVTGNVERMRVAVGIDAVCMLLWFATAVMGCAWCCRARRVRRKSDKLLEGGSEDEGRDVEMGGR